MLGECLQGFTKLGLFPSPSTWNSAPGSGAVSCSDQESSAAAKAGFKMNTACAELRKSSQERAALTAMLLIPFLDVCACAFLGPSHRRIFTAGTSKVQSHKTAWKKWFAQTDGHESTTSWTVFGPVQAEDGVIKAVLSVFQIEEKKNILQSWSAHSATSSTEAFYAPESCNQGSHCHCSFLSCAFPGFSAVAHRRLQPHYCNHQPY